MGDFLCRQDERRRSYQAPSADSSDDDVDDTTLSGRAHLLCWARAKRSFNPPLSKDPSSKATNNVDDATHVSRDDIAAAASFCFLKANFRKAAMQSGANSRSWTAFTSNGSMGRPRSSLLNLRGASRSRLGPNSLKIEKETTHDLV